MSDLKTEIIVRSIKIFAIAYYLTLSFIFCFLIAKYIDKFFVYLYGTDFEKKTTTILYIEALTQIIFLGITGYILRNIIQSIPFPFEGIYGFHYMKVKEVTTPSTITLFLFIFQYKYHEKLSYIRDKKKLYHNY
jgi:hypothetical protein